MSARNAGASGMLPLGRSARYWLYTVSGPESSDFEVAILLSYRSQSGRFLRRKPGVWWGSTRRPKISKFGRRILRVTEAKTTTLDLVSLEVLDVLLPNN